MSIVTTDNPPESITGTPQAPPVHTLSVFVNNKAGVLMRICQVFARRGYNIDSLVVSHGRDEHFSRMTIGISGDPAGLEQIILQVTKLIDVIHCIEHTSSDSVTKELLLVRSAANHRPLWRKNHRPHPDLNDRHAQWRYDQDRCRPHYVLTV
jgi:acetolactate synthase-1/3 small subunit